MSLHAQKPEKKRFLVCPGEVRSRTDGDIHFIKASDLIRLYCLRPEDCEVRQRNGNYHLSDYEAVYHPRSDGKYPIFEPPPALVESQ